MPQDYVRGRVPIEALLKDHDRYTARGYGLASLDTAKKFLNNSPSGETDTNFRGKDHLLSECIDVLQQGGVLYLSYGNLKERRQINNIAGMIEDIVTELEDTELLDGLTIATDLVSQSRQNPALNGYVDKQTGWKTWKAFATSLSEGDGTYLGEREVAEYGRKIIDLVKSKRKKGLNITAVEPSTDSQQSPDRSSARYKMADKIGKGPKIVVCHEDEVRYGSLQVAMIQRFGNIPRMLTVSQSVPYSLSNPNKYYTKQELASLGARVKDALKKKSGNVKGLADGLENIVFDVRSFKNPFFAVDYFVKGRYDRLRKDDVGRKKTNKGGNIIYLTKPWKGVPHNTRDKEVREARLEVPSGYMTAVDWVKAVNSGTFPNVRGNNLLTNKQLEKIRDLAVGRGEKIGQRYILDGEGLTPDEENEMIYVVYGWLKAGLIAGHPPGYLPVEKWMTKASGRQSATQSRTEIFLERLDKAFRTREIGKDEEDPVITLGEALDVVLVQELGKDVAGKFLNNELNHALFTEFMATYGDD